MTELDIQNYRIQSSMVIHQLEQDLGNFITSQAKNVNELPSKIIESISDRERSQGRDTNSDDVAWLVESTYIDEVFSLSLSISKGSNYYENLLKLKNLCKALELYDIRNAISHPNRPFPENYWHRASVIATSPLIEMIGLSKVLPTYRAAVEGRLTPPPSEWLEQPAWQVPNNLPKGFDHDITGLVGRRRTITEVKKLISNPRHLLIAIVAPGGVGKTALVLEVLKDASKDPKTLAFADGFVFVSMKTERLTSTGIQTLDAVETIESLKEEIMLNTCSVYDVDLVDNFDSFIKSNKEKNIFFCIDNLETLLRDKPEAFESLIDSFPASWRVIVTSRVSVNSANTLPLKNMEIAEAEKLARSYSSRRNITHLSQRELTKIAEICDKNPLAIRLTVDAINTGSNLLQAIGKAKGDVTEFAYTHLISSLRKETIEVLEALFVGTEMTREEIIEALGASLDNVAESLLELRRTSLISSKQDENQEKYSLITGVRELLATNPINLPIRSNIINSINRKRELVSEIRMNQKSLNINSLDYWYIPENEPENLQILVKEVHTAIRRKTPDYDEISALYKKFNGFKEMYVKNSTFWRSFGQVSLKLKDIALAKECFQNAIQINSDDLSSLRLLAKLHHYEERDFPAAENVYTSIINTNSFSKIENNDRFIQDVYNGLYHAILYQHKYNSIVEATVNWKKETILRGIMGCFRASALKRVSETERDHLKKLKLLIRAITIISDVLRTNGVFKSSISVSKNILNAIETIFEREYSNIEADAVETFIDFAKTCISQLPFNSSEISIHEDFLTRLKGSNLSKIKQRTEELSDPNENKFDIELPDDDDRLVEVTVYSIPGAEPDMFPHYVFAKDSKQKEYFLHSGRLNNADWDAWKCVDIGSTFLALPELAQHDDRAVGCSDLYLVSL